MNLQEPAAARRHLARHRHRHRRRRRRARVGAGDVDRHDQDAWRTPGATIAQSSCATARRPKCGSALRPRCGAARRRRVPASGATPTASRSCRRKRCAWSICSARRTAPRSTSRCAASGRRSPALRPELKIIAGPHVHARPSTKSSSARRRMRSSRDSNIGEQITTRGATWTVVGIFTSGGDSHESELMTDAETLIAAEQRGGFQSVTVHAGVAGGVPEVQGFADRQPGARRGREPRARVLPRSSRRPSARSSSIIAYVVGGIMAVGAIFSALNTMYSAVSARLREIATLRAIGFGATAMVMSVLAEALLLALHRRRDRRSARVAVLQWPHGQHLRRRPRRRSTGLRAERQPGAHRHWASSGPA